MSKKNCLTDSFGKNISGFAKTVAKCTNTASDITDEKNDLCSTEGYFSAKHSDLAGIMCLYYTKLMEERVFAQQIVMPDFQADAVRYGIQQMINTVPYEKT